MSVFQPLGTEENPEHHIWPNTKGQLQHTKLLNPSMLTVFNQDQVDFLLELYRIRNAIFRQEVAARWN